MASTKQKTIFTIGHSTRTQEEFIKLLKGFSIHLLADIRSYPGSKRFPHFNKEALQKTLPEQHIAYQHFPALGGRRKTTNKSKNTAWKNAAFRGYADYMETEEFKNAIAGLEAVAKKQTTAYMCSEAVWWSCHRSLVSDYLKWKGWNVIHIMGENKSQEHPYTSPAKVVDGKLSYAAEQLNIF
jgi:uncharacterized protein (DUF488 family)